MKEKDANIEEMLLSNASLDDLIRMKIEAEFNEEMKKAKELNSKKEKKIYTNIKDVPREYVFSKAAVYKYYNRHTKCETFINGIQADALLGLQSNIRQKILDRELSTFSTDDAYVKFESVCVDS